MKMWRCIVCGLLDEEENPPWAILRWGGQSAREQEQAGMIMPVLAPRYCLDMAGEH
jgi:hypothetical protein